VLTKCIATIFRGLGSFPPAQAMALFFFDLLGVNSFLSFARGNLYQFIMVAKNVVVFENGHE
jgi:hypothetical protein